MIFVIESKGFKIEYDDSNFEYTIYNSKGEVVKNTKSKDVFVKFLNNPEVATKKKKEYKHIPIFLMDYNCKIEKGKATSVGENKYNWSSAQVWVSVDGKTSKENVEGVFLDTKENETIVKEIQVIANKISSLNKEQSSKKKSLKTITCEMLEF